MKMTQEHQAILIKKLEMFPVVSQGGNVPTLMTFTENLNRIIASKLYAKDPFISTIWYCFGLVNRKDSRECRESGAKTIISELYEYLDDDHIETFLKKWGNERLQTEKEKTSSPV